MTQQLQVPVPPSYPKETNVSLTPESLIDKSLYRLIDDYGLKPILERLAILISEECVTLRPDKAHKYEHSSHSLEKKLIRSIMALI